MMRSVCDLAVILIASLSAGLSHAAEFRPAVHEVWAGTYTCGAMERDPNQRPGYSSRAQLVLENGMARVTRESARMRETLTGQVAADGSVRLEGSGDSKEGGGAHWRYRFDGKFEGDRFTAKGAMLSTNLATRLRDCSMALTRVQASGGPAPRQAAAAVVPAQPSMPPAAPKAEKPAAAPLAAAPPPPVKITEGKELNFTKGNDAAVVHGKVSRSTLHRYPVVAKKGQTLAVTLQSDGARLDVYEPGASIDIQANGFVVQGTRLKAPADGARVSAELPADGQYLLLVRSSKDEASYALEIAVATSPSSAQDAASGETWLNDKTLWGTLLLLLVAAGVGLVMYSKRDRRLFRTR